MKSPRWSVGGGGARVASMVMALAIGCACWLALLAAPNAHAQVQAQAQAVETGKLTQRYGYDQADRLSQIRYIRNEGTPHEQLIEQIDFTYDAKGQVKSRTTLNGHGSGVQDTPFTATYDAANRMTAITLNVGGASKTYTLTHDANGNLTTRQNTADPSDTTTYTWDSRDRLTRITQPGLSASFTHDAFGRRIQSSITKDGTTSTVQYVYEGLQVLGEVRDGKLSHRLLTGVSLDETIARIAIAPSGQRDPAQSRLFLTDALNSVIAQMNDDETASLATSHGYSPYGESQTIGPDATGNPIQYTSRENDGTGLMYYRARHYDPVLKRFISEDPIGLAGGFNPYAYVDNAPLIHTDPEGLTKRGPKEIAKPTPLPVVSGGRLRSTGGANLIQSIPLAGGDIKPVGGASIQCPTGYDRLVKDPPFNPHGQKVFTNGKTFLTLDADGHNGGVWKLFDRHGNRLGTYDANMNRIKK
ncbi:RHS repeat-associated core domain-containing protein [Hydrogenophaga sp. XSHU_21]